MRKLLLGALVLVCLTPVLLLCAASSAFAQEVTAAITGTISDQSGAAIVGASVTAKSVERGVTSTAVTDDTGSYRISHLPVGSYDLRVEKQGFQTALYPTFTLVLNQTGRVDIVLKVGQVSQTVEVTGAAPVLKTETTQVDTIIDAYTNEALPLATRNYVQLTLLAPGSVTTNPGGFNTGDNTGSGARPLINGNREQSNNFLLDGMDNNQVSDNLLGYTPAPDAIQEFNLITNNASAEFGNFQGGIVSATIKSGSNGFHGDIWEFFRNDVLNANNWSNNFNTADGVWAPLPKDKLRWNMFGGTLGGPVIKNKLFFFVDYQGQRFNHPSSTSSFTVFTPAEQSGDFSALLDKGIQLYNPCQAGTGVTGVACVASATRTAFPNNQIPVSMISPVAAALFASPLYPKTVNNNLQQNALQTTASALSVNQGDVKVDYIISDKDRISWRLSHAYQSNPGTNSQLLIGNNYSTTPIWNTVGDWTRTINPSLINDARFGWSHVTLNNGNSFDPSVGAYGETIGIPGSNPSGLIGLLSLGMTGSYISNLGSTIIAQSFDDHVWQADDSVTWTHGRHTFKFGGQYQHQIIKTFYSGNNGELGFMNFGNFFTADKAEGPSVNTGEAMGDFFLGLDYQFGRGLSSGKTWQQSTNIFSGYIQDTWRVNDRLTLNLGLRYEAHTPWVETNDQQSNYDITTQQIVYANQNNNSRSLYKGFYGGKDFQPRFGFAWTPAMLGGHTVVRGAFTISSYMEGTGTNLRLPINPPFNPAEFQVNYFNQALPTTTASDGIIAPPPPPSGCPDYSCFAGALLRVWDPNVQPAIADQWNLTIQHQFWKDTTFQIGYVGQRGVHLMVPFDYAQLTKLPDSACETAPCTGPSKFFDQNPELASIMSVYASGTQSNGKMSYNSLQAVLQKQMSHGLQYQVAYTYSKCMTDSSGYYGSWGAQAAPASPYWQNIYDQKAEWAPCYYDSTHVLTAYAIYELPFGRGRAFGKDMNKVANAVVGGWAVSPIYSYYTGFPLAIQGNSDPTGTNSRGQRADCLKMTSPQGRVPISGSGGIQWFTNNGNFADNTTGNFGSCPAQLGWLRGPGYSNLDLSLQKDFQLTERFKLQFRTDFLNAFNHVNLNMPNGSYISVGGTMGQITGAQSPRNIQFALKIYY
jgi:hypothetical protein